MAGRPKARARIAAMVALQGGTPLPPAGKIFKKRGRPPGSQNAAKVVTSLPAPEVRAPVDTIDTNFGAALAAVASGGDMNEVFQELRAEAMKFALQIMRMELDPDEKSFNKLIGVKQQITTAILTATTRVRPGDLRERDDDGLGALLDKLKQGDGPTAEDLLN